MSFSPLFVAAIFLGVWGLYLCYLSYLWWSGKRGYKF